MEVLISQNTQEWLLYRSKMIGASDIPAIMGLSPHKTALQIFAQKMNPDPFQHEQNFAQAKGSRLEPEARRLFENETGLPWPAVTLVSDEIPYLMASLDGYNQDTHETIEIKYQGRDAHLSGEIPKHYLMQMQAQFLVSGADRGYFISYNPDVTEDPFKYQTVYRDGIAHLEIIRAAKKFYDAMRSGLPPEQTQQDVVEISDGTVVAQLMEKYLQAKRDLVIAEETVEILRKEIIKNCEQDGLTKAKYKNTTITKATRPGNVDYKKIDALKGIDLEQYRGKATMYWTIK